MLFLCFYFFNRDVSNIIEMTIMLWSFYSVIFAFLMGNLGLMKYWSKLWMFIFNVKYEVTGYWSSRNLHSFTVWSYPIVMVNNKNYKLTLAVMGSNLYDEDDVIRRKSIVLSMF